MSKAGDQSFTFFYGRLKKLIEVGQIDQIQDKA